VLIEGSGWDANTTEVVLCTEAESITVRNISDHSSQVRLATGHPMDILMIDGVARVTGPVQENPETVALLNQRTGWDPRRTSGDWVFLRIKVDEIQAWRGVDEIQGCVVMRNGVWLS